jgi:hypothetical protein
MSTTLKVRVNRLFMQGDAICLFHPLRQSLGVPGVNTNSTGAPFLGVITLGL